MRQNKEYVRKPRRNVGAYSITTPDLALSPRVLLDRVSKGLPVNAQMSKHIPLPPDGLDPEDWDTGMEEILDVTDAVAHAEKIKRDIAYVQEQKKKELEKQTGVVDTQTAANTSGEA